MVENRVLILGAFVLLVLLLARPRRLASEVLHEVGTLDRKITGLNERIEAEVEASGSTFTQTFAIGLILAARIIGMVGKGEAFPYQDPLVRLLLWYGAA
jgi:hypothetical protein